MNKKEVESSQNLCLRILNFHLLGFNQKATKGFKVWGVLAAEQALKDFCLVLAMCEEYKQRIVDLSKDGGKGDSHAFIVRQLLWTIRDIISTFFNPENIQRTCLILQERIRLSKKEGLGEKERFANLHAQLADKHFYENPYSEINNILERIFRFGDGKDVDLINALQKTLIDRYNKVTDIEVFRFK